MNRILLPLLICCFLGMSCSPRPVFRMSPAAENTTFNQGTEYVNLNEGGVDFTISYYQHMGKKFVMDVEIVNNTDSVMRIRPDQFSYRAYENMSGNFPRKSDKVLAARKAISPEHELIRKDLEIAQSKANQRTTTLLFAIGQTASIAQSVMEENPEKREELSESYIAQEVSHHRRERHRAALRDQREVWELEAIRTTDLFPGEYIRGFVFFKNEPDAKGYTITFKKQTLSFSAFYRQQKYGGQP